jgi:phosphate transport system substrate-binding protein
MKWIQTYNDAHPDVKVDYAGGGSGAGIKGITDRTVNYAGSDAPMTADQEGKTPAKVLHLPTVAGPVVMIYNLPDVKEQLTLDGATIADIYLGNIKTWNDPKIAKLNPGVALPNKPVVVVHRSDGSGTTFIFTNYLAKVSKDWADKVGNATAVEWPLGLGGKGNPGVAANVKNTVGGIGYVESAYAVKENLTYAKQINKDGKTVVASIEGVVAASESSVKTFPEDLKVSITDAAGVDSYPICGFTYLLVYDDLSYMKDKDAATKLVKFIEWCITEGQATAKDLGYAKLPKEAQEKVLTKLKAIKFDGETLLK